MHVSNTNIENCKENDRQALLKEILDADILGLSTEELLEYINMNKQQKKEQAKRTLASNGRHTGKAGAENHSFLSATGIRFTKGAGKIQIIHLAGNLSAMAEIQKSGNNCDYLYPAD